jgi:hypothetical protein
MTATLRSRSRCCGDVEPLSQRAEPCALDQWLWEQAHTIEISQVEVGFMVSPSFLAHSMMKVGYLLCAVELTLTNAPTEYTLQSRAHQFLYIFVPAKISHRSYEPSHSSQIPGIPA